MNARAVLVIMQKEKKASLPQPDKKLVVTDIWREIYVKPFWQRKKLNTKFLFPRQCFNLHIDK